MKASTATPSLDRLEPALFARWAGPKCELLFDVFNGELGQVHLGRMLSGNDAGRLVTLRSLPGAPSAELAIAIDLARSIAHPRLAKALGVLRVDDSWYLASEYIPGVTSFELAQVLAARGEKMAAPVAVRVTLDVLDAVVAARTLLFEAAHASPARCIYPECVWIADFGETFLAEVSASAIIADAARSVADDPPLDDSAEAQDVRAAGLQLLELACGSTARSALRDPFLPDALREIAARATGIDGSARYASARAFAQALLELDPSLIATEEEVSADLRRLMASVLDTRQRKLAMTERVSSQECEQDETRFFRAAAALAERDTARPPTELAAHAAEARTRSSKQPALTRSEPPEDPTTVFRRRNVGTDSCPDIVLEAQTQKAALPLAAVVDRAPSAAPPALDLALAPVGARSAAPRRVAYALLLLAAFVAFGMTSGPHFWFGRSVDTSVAQASLRWLRTQSAKVWHRLH